MVSVRGFAEAASRAGGLGVDSNTVKMCTQANMPNTVEILQLPFIKASLVFWLFLASTKYFPTDMLYAI